MKKLHFPCTRSLARLNGRGIEGKPVGRPAGGSEDGRGRNRRPEPPWVHMARPTPCKEQQGAPSHCRNGNRETQTHETSTRCHVYPPFIGPDDAGRMWTPFGILCQRAIVAAAKTGPAGPGKPTWARREGNVTWLQRRGLLSYGSFPAGFLAPVRLPETRVHLASSRTPRPSEANCRQIAAVNEFQCISAALMTPLARRPPTSSGTKASAGRLRRGTEEFGQYPVQEQNAAAP